MTTLSPQAPPSTLAEAIEQYRLARNLTPADTARAIGVPPTQLSRWRRGGGISIPHLQKVADWMGVPRATLDPLAGYPSGLGTLDSSEDADPRLQAIRSVWSRLDEYRKDIIHEIAVSRSVGRTLTGAKRSFGWA